MNHEHSQTSKSQGLKNQKNFSCQPKIKSCKNFSLFLRQIFPDPKQQRCQASGAMKQQVKFLPVNFSSGSAPKKIRQTREEKRFFRFVFPPAPNFPACFGCEVILAYKLHRKFDFRTG